MTIEPVLADFKKADGTHAIKIKIQSGREPKEYISTGFYCSPDNWNKKARMIEGSNKYARKANLKISEILTRLDVIISEYAGEKVSARMIKDLYVAPGPSGSRSQVPTLSEVFLSDLKRFEGPEEYETYRSYKSIYEGFYTFVGEKKPVTAATKEMILSYIHHLKTDLLNGDSTIRGKLKKIRHVINGVESLQVDPFKNIKLPKDNDTVADPLDKQEFAALKNMQFTPRNFKRPSDFYWASVARDMAVFMKYCAGMRIRDAILLQWDEVQGDEIKYNPHKSKGKTLLNFTLPRQCIEILEKYRSIPTGYHKNPDYVFRLIKNGPKHPNVQASSISSSIRKGLDAAAELAGIDRKISPHKLRDTFVDEASETFSTREVMNLVGHKKESTTAVYQTRMKKKPASEKLQRLADLGDQD